MTTATATRTHLEYKWTVSRGRDTYGYNICTLYADGRKVSRCDGGGYDMEGTCLGSFLAKRYADRLVALKTKDFPRGHDGKRAFYGLTFHDPNYDPGKAIVGEDCDDRTLDGKGKGQTVAEREAAGKSLGLERYQAIYSASSPVPTKRHTIPSIDGGCGKNCVETIGNAIGLRFEYIPCRSRNLSMATMHDERE